MDENENEATEDDTAEPQDDEGIVGLVGGALSKLCLNAEQREAAGQIGKQVSPIEKEVVLARDALVLGLAKQLRTGEIAEQPLAKQIDAFVKAREKEGPVLRKALEDLHGVLDQDRRIALANAIESRLKEKGAYLAGGWYEVWGKDLNLSKEQQARIQGAFTNARADLEKERATMVAAFEAFKKEDFSCEKVAPVTEVGKQTHATVEKMFDLNRELASTLSPEQRDQIAKKIESMSREHGAPESEVSAPSAGGEMERDGQSQEALRP